MASTKEFSFFFSDPKKVIFCGYRDFGLLCLDQADDNKITFISTITSDDNNSNVWFGKISTITLCPPLPTTANFTQIVPNRNGSKIALISQKLIAIVEMCEDFWVKQSLFNATGVSEFQKTYFAQCNILHISLFVGTYIPTIIKACWYLNKNLAPIKNEKTAPLMICERNLLAVLYSDNVIRLYDVSKSIERAVITIDFNNIFYSLADLELNETKKTDRSEIYNAGSRFGYSQLVSFDFGPTYLLSENEKPYNDLATILAMSSDGQLYLAAIEFLDQNFFGPFGPITMLKSDLLTEKFTCVASDLIFVRHKFASLLPIFAMSSCEGVLLHFILIQAESPETLVKSNRNVFDAYVYDVFEIEDNYKNYSSLILQNDLSERATYVALSNNNAYFVDINSWATTIYHKMIENSDDLDASFDQNIQLPLKETRFLHIFMFVDKNIYNYKNNESDHDSQTLKNTQETKYKKNCIHSLACIRLGNSNSFVLDELVENEINVSDTTDQIFIALTKGGNSMTSFVRHRVSIAEQNQFCSPIKKTQTIKEDFFVNKVQALLKSTDQFKPTISLEGLSKEEELKFCRKITEKILENLQKREEAVDFSMTEAQKLLTKFDKIGLAHTELSNRVEQIFNKFTIAKTKIVEYEKNFRFLDVRIRKITQIMQPIVFPIQKNEKEIINQLQGMQAKIDEYMQEINEAHIKAATIRRKFLGLLKPFQASAKAQKFMLSKSQKEIQQLETYVKKLTTKAENIENDCNLCE